MGLISTAALSLPILTLVATRLAGYKTFPALVVYYGSAVAYNLLTQGYVKADAGIIRAVGFTNNLLDAPLTMTFLLYFSTSPKLASNMKILIGAFIGFEALIVLIFGFTRLAMTIILGPGLIAVLCFSIPFFVSQTKMSIMHHKSTGKAFMSASLLFAYGCFIIIYVIYYLLNIRNTEDAFLVFFLVSTVSSLLMSIGMFIERKRVKKLSELKVVRKELSELYSNDKPAAPLRPAYFDFDKDQWN